MSLFPVVLSGGSGTRLWPLSRSSLPKQLLALHSARTMIQETVARSGLPGAKSPILLCNDEHRFLVAEQMMEMGVKPSAIVLEPMGRNTAPAAAVAALVAREMDPDAIIALLPSDHVVGNEDAFRAAVKIAVSAAETGKIVTFGMTPTSPETGYGYIQKGEPLGGIEGAYKVACFKEKPNETSALEYLADGNYYWNGGMFVFRADVMLGEIERLEPRILPAVHEALRKAARDTDFIRLDADSFVNAPNIALDYAVMERTDRAAIVPCDISWNDVGAWSALWEVRPRDEKGNVFQGDVVAYDSEGSLVLSEGGLTALVGVRDLVIINTKDALLVADKAKSQDVKAIVDKLKGSRRSEAVEHTLKLRPWGSSEVVDRGENFSVSHVMLKPGMQVTLRTPGQQNAHWTVVQGRAHVTCGEQLSVLNENQSICMSNQEPHRIENPGTAPLRAIVIRSGDDAETDGLMSCEAG